MTGPQSDDGSGLPADLASLERGPRSIGLLVQASSYPLSAVYGAAYVFLDRCWVLLDKPDATHVRVTLAAKAADGNGGASLDTLAAEFAEELVSAAWRVGVEHDTRSLIEAAVARAHAGGDAPPSLDELAGYEFAGDAGAATEDPLGIAMSWEEKHKAKKEE
jgi:His-Xaa-Ser system protein HxsD